MIEAILDSRSPKEYARLQPPTLREFLYRILLPAMREGMAEGRKQILLKVGFPGAGKTTFGEAEDTAILDEFNLREGNGVEKVNFEKYRDIARLRGMPINDLEGRRTQEGFALITQELVTPAMISAIKDPNIPIISGELLMTSQIKSKGRYTGVDVASSTGYGLVDIDLRPEGLPDYDLYIVMFVAGAYLRKAVAENRYLTKKDISFEEVQSIAERFKFSKKPKTPEEALLIQNDGAPLAIMESLRDWLLATLVSNLPQIRGLLRLGGVYGNFPYLDPLLEQDWQVSRSLTEVVDGLTLDQVGRIIDMGELVKDVRRENIVTGSVRASLLRMGLVSGIDMRNKIYVVDNDPQPEDLYEAA